MCQGLILLISSFLQNFVLTIFLRYQILFQIRAIDFQSF